MASAFLGLNTSKLGIMTHQTNLYTVGHNVSNAATQGYSRQLVTNVSTPSVDFYGSAGKYWVGTGSNISAVSRARDFLVDRQLWKQNATNAYFSNLNSVQSKTETIFTEPSDTNFQAMLDHFWTSVQNVASNPGDTGTRTTMRQSGVDLVDIIQSSAKQLGDQVTDINESIRKSVDRINQVTTEILALNKQISMSEVTGGKANDLRDKRDLLVDELSQYARVQVNEDNMNNYIVNFDGQVVVDGRSTTRLEIYENKNLEIYKQYGYQTLDVRIASVPPIGLNFTDGSIAGLLEARDSDRQGIYSRLNMLNDISKALLCDFNQIHKEGMGLDNSTGLNFFGDSGVQYADLAASTNPITGVVTPAIPGFDPIVAGANNAEKNWIHSLKVNDVFFDPISGLDKIAAKTLAGNLEVVLSTANRINSITTVPPTGTGLPAGVTQAEMEFVGESQIVFKGISPTTIDISIDAGGIDADGFVTAATYTFTVDGVTYSYPADCTNDTGKSVLKLKGDIPFEFNIEVALHPQNATNALAAGDTYRLEVYPTTGGSASLQNTPFTIHDSLNQYNYTLINTGVNTAAGTNGEVTGLDLSFDGGATVNMSGTLVGPSADGTGQIFRFIGTLPDGKDFAFDMEVKNDRGNTVGDQYSFKMPPSEAASDNAVRMSQFLKYGADDKAVTEHSRYMGTPQYRAVMEEKSIDEEYNEALSTLGVQTQTSYSMWTNQMTLLEQISTTRSNIKDVSLDEELTNMIMFQKGYNSNSRMLTAMDEMLDKLINGTGRVGL